MRHGLIALALAGGVFCGLLCSRQPWKEFDVNRQKADAVRAEMLKLEGRKADLMQTTARLETPFGLELEARKSGFRKRDEVRISGF